MDAGWTGRLIRRFLEAALLGAVALVFIPAGADAYIYWSNAHDAPNAIGRANLDGTEVDPQFIPSAGEGCDIAVDQSYVYWSHTENGAAF